MNRVPERGSVLILAVWVLVFLSIINTALYRIAWTRLDVAQRVQRAAQVQARAQGALAHAQYHRLIDATAYDTVGELRSIGAEFAGQLHADAYEFLDEARKLNVNTASSEELARLPAGTEDLARIITESRRLPVPVVEALTLIDGVDPETVAQWKPFLTVYGDGAVNINTAPPEVLRAVGLDEDLISIILRYRAGPDGIPGTEDDGMFESGTEILSTLRDFTALFASQQTALLGLINRKRLGVAGEVFTVRVQENTPAGPVQTQEVTFDPGAVLQWR